MPLPKVVEATKVVTVRGAERFDFLFWPDDTADERRDGALALNMQSAHHEMVPANMLAHNHATALSVSGLPERTMQLGLNVRRHRDS